MTKMTKEQFEDLLRSYGFVNNSLISRGPQWWTYGGYKCDNNAFLINKNDTAFIYPYVIINPVTGSLRFGRSMGYDGNAHDFNLIAREVPRLVNNIKIAIKTIRREAIDRL